MDDELDFEGESEVVGGPEELDFEGDVEVLDEGVEYAGRDLRKAKAPVPGGAFTSYLLGLSNWGTFGFGDEISGAVGAGIEGTKALVTGENPIAAAGKGYTETRDYSRDLSDRAWDQHPVAYGAGVTTSMLGPTGGVGLAAKGAKVTTKMARGAGLGALAGVGFSEADTLAGVAQDAALGGVFGGAVPAVVPLAKGAGKITLKASTGLGADDFARMAKRGARLDRVQTPDKLGELAHRRIEDLSKKASAASREAIDDLAKADPLATVNVSNLKRALTEELKSSPGGAQASGLREALQRIKSRDVNAQEAAKLRTLAGKTQGKERRALNKQAKNLKQEARLKPLDTRDVIDTLQKYSDFKGNNIINDPALKRNVRELTFFRTQQHMLNEELKQQFPKYRARMEDASGANHLLERSQKVLGKVGDDLSDGATGGRLQRMAAKEGHDIKKLEQLDEIDNFLGTKHPDRMTEYARDASTNAVLKKATTQGSRNAVAGASIGFATAGPLGVLPGVFTGYVLDAYGRQMVVGAARMGQKASAKSAALQQKLTAAAAANPKLGKLLETARILTSGSNPISDPRVLAGIVATKMERDPELQEAVRLLTEEIERESEGEPDSRRMRTDPTYRQQRMGGGE